MENASKALIMAGTILISIMVVSLGVYIINMFGEYTSNQEQERANQQIAEFNAEFLKYEGRTDITAQDIVTVANLAKENNDFYELTIADASDSNPMQQSSYYISVQIPIDDNELLKKVGNSTSKSDKKHFEECINKELFLQKYSTKGTNPEEIKTYKCDIGKIIISDVTKMVSQIIFE